MSEDPGSSSTLLQDIMDEIPEGLQVISHDWRYLYVNKAVAVQGKRRREDLIGKTMMECYPGIEATPIFAQLKKCAEDKKASLLDNEFIFPDGSIGWFRLFINPWENGVLILSIDITDHKLKETEMAKRIKELGDAVDNPEHKVDDLKEIIRKMAELVPHVDPAKFHE